MDRSIDRKGQVTVYEYTAFDQDPNTLDRTITYTDDTLSDKLEETVFDPATGQQKYILAYNAGQDIVARREFVYAGEDLSQVLVFNTSEISDADARTTGLGTLDSTFFYSKTVFKVPVVNRVENADGSVDTYTYDAVGRGFLQKISRKNAEGYLLFENFFENNTYLESKLVRGFTYERIGNADVRKTQTLYFYDTNQELIRTEEYEILGQTDDLTTSGLSPPEGDAADRILTVTIFEDGSPKKIENTSYLSNGDIKEYSETDLAPQCTTRTTK